MSAFGDRRNRLLERRLIAFRRLGGSAQLPHELKRGVMDLIVRRWGIEIEQWFDISAHDLLPFFSSLPPRGGMISHKSSRVSVIYQRTVWPRLLI
ncbi:hypothetical protein FHX14_005124 [Rhizobium sp. BK619]|nr:hypothetical protein [Rhizobium sp. BK619]